jgi:hypothetical protein
MKLKAPQGAGDPCVAGAVIAARDGLYEVEAEIGALLIECFGFTEAGARGNTKTPVSSTASGAPRRRAPSRQQPA